MDGDGGLKPQKWQRRGQIYLIGIAGQALALVVGVADTLCMRCMARALQMLFGSRIDGRT